MDRVESRIYAFGGGALEGISNDFLNAVNQNYNSEADKMFGRLWEGKGIGEKPEFYKTTSDDNNYRRYGFKNATLADGFVREMNKNGLEVVMTNTKINGQYLVEVKYGKVEYNSFGERVRTEVPDNIKESFTKGTLEYEQMTGVSPEEMKDTYDGSNGMTSSDVGRDLAYLTVGRSKLGSTVLRGIDFLERALGEDAVMATDAKEKNIVSPYDGEEYSVLGDLGGARSGRETYTYLHGEVLLDGKGNRVEDSIKNAGSKKERKRYEENYVHATGKSIAKTEYASEVLKEDELRQSRLEEEYLKKNGAYNSEENKGKVLKPIDREEKDIHKRRRLSKAQRTMNNIYLSEVASLEGNVFGLKGGSIDRMVKDFNTNAVALTLGSRRDLADGESELLNKYMSHLPDINLSETSERDLEIIKSVLDKGYAENFQERIAVTNLIKDAEKSLYTERGENGRMGSPKAEYFSGKKNLAEGESELLNKYMSHLPDINLNLTSDRDLEIIKSVLDKGYTENFHEEKAITNLIKDTEKSLYTERDENGKLGSPKAEYLSKEDAKTHEMMVRNSENNKIRLTDEDAKTHGMMARSSDNGGIRLTHEEYTMFAGALSKSKSILADLGVDLQKEGLNRMSILEIDKKFIEKASKAGYQLVKANGDVDLDYVKKLTSADLKAIGVSSETRDVFVELNDGSWKVSSGIGGLAGAFARSVEKASDEEMRQVIEGARTARMTYKFTKEGVTSVANSVKAVRTEINKVKMSKTSGADASKFTDISYGDGTEILKDRKRHGKVSESRNKKHIKKNEKKVKKMERREKSFIGRTSKKISRTKNKLIEKFDVFGVRNKLNFTKMLQERIGKLLIGGLKKYIAYAIVLSLSITAFAGGAYIIGSAVATTINNIVEGAVNGVASAIDEVIGTDYSKPVAYRLYQSLEKRNADWINELENTDAIYNKRKELLFGMDYMKLKAYCDSRSKWLYSDGDDIYINPFDKIDADILENNKDKLTTVNAFDGKEKVSVLSNANILTINKEASEEKSGRIVIASNGHTDNTKDILSMLDVQYESALEESDDESLKNILGQSSAMIAWNTFWKNITGLFKWIGVNLKELVDAENEDNKDGKKYDFKSWVDVNGYTFSYDTLKNYVFNLWEMSHQQIITLDVEFYDVGDEITFDNGTTVKLTNQKVASRFGKCINPVKKSYKIAVHGSGIQPYIGADLDGDGIDEKKAFLSGNGASSVLRVTMSDIVSPDEACLWSSMGSDKATWERVKGNKCWETTVNEEDTGVIKEKTGANGGSKVVDEYLAGKSPLPTITPTPKPNASPTPTPSVTVSPASESLSDWQKRLKEDLKSSLVAGDLPEEKYVLTANGGDTKSKMQETKFVATPDGEETVIKEELTSSKIADIYDTKALGEAMQRWAEGGRVGQAPNGADFKVGEKKVYTYVITIKKTVAKEVKTVKVRHCKGHQFAYCGGHVCVNSTGNVLSVTNEQIAMTGAVGEELATPVTKHVRENMEEEGLGEFAGKNTGEFDYTTAKTAYESGMSTLNASATKQGRRQGTLINYIGLNLKLVDASRDDTDWATGIAPYESDSRNTTRNTLRDIFDADTVLLKGCNVFPYDLRNGKGFDGYTGWNADKMEQAVIKASTNWSDIYEFDIPSELCEKSRTALADSDIDKIIEGLKKNYGASFTEKREDIVRAVLLWIGRAEYSDAKEHVAHDILLNEMEGTERQVDGSWVDFTYNSTSGNDFSFVDFILGITGNTKSVVDSVSSIDEVKCGDVLYHHGIDYSELNITNASQLQNYSAMYDKLYKKDQYVFYIGKLSEDVTLMDGTVLKAGIPLTADLNPSGTVTLHYNDSKGFADAEYMINNYYWITENSGMKVMRIN